MIRNFYERFDDFACAGIPQEEEKVEEEEK